ncbi:MAG TPA: response regulator transcription factor [Chloroflexota bacterium]|nr:response regulator transcription factor [Chloroflexota bacterium]
MAVQGDASNEQPGEGFGYDQPMVRPEAESRGNVLVVDDDRTTVELVRMYLERDRYAVHVAYDGPTALKMAGELHPDLVILDWMLPGVDGLTICENLRASSTVGIIMLTARVTESDKLVGLTSGADDYLTKPFSPRELTVRVGVILRRLRGAGSVPEAGSIEAGPIRIDFLERQVFAAGRPVALTRTEFDLLGAFVRHPRRVFTREQLIQLALQDDPDVLPRTVDVHVNNMRRKLRQEGQAEVIGTVFGVGYRLDV